MAGKQKAVFGVWSEIKVSELNRLLKPHGLRLVAKGSKEWGNKVTVTVQPTEQPHTTRLAPAGPESFPPPAGPAGGVCTYPLCGCLRTDAVAPCPEGLAVAASS